MIIEFLPDYSSWDDWNGNLVHFFGEQQFPVLPEAQWADVALSICVNPVFDKFGVPYPDLNGTWQDWAYQLVAAVNGQGS